MHIASPVVQYYRNGWFSFRFTSQEDMNNVLREGPWKLGSSSLIMKQWYPNFSMEMDKVSTVPIWVLLPDLEPFLWLESVLSKMASKIGKPFFADLNTTCKTKLSFARILVEADVSATLPDQIVLNTPFHGCGKLGHQIGSCKWHQPKPRRDPKKVYRAKPASDPIPPSVPQPEAALGSVCHKLGGTSTSQAEITKPDPVQGNPVPSTGPSHGQAVVSSSLAAEMHSECHELGQQSPQHVGSPRMWRRNLLIKYPMKISSWNIRGCNDHLKQQEISDFLWRNKLDVFGVLKTRIKEKKAGNLIKNKFSKYSVICNYDFHYNGRIWLIYNPTTVIVTPLISHAQFIHCAITHHATSKQIFLTMDFVTSWVLLGDFNVGRDVSEKVSSTPPDLDDILAFNACLLNCRLDDIGGSGCEYTWTNKQDDSTRTWSKLDRALANPDLFNYFPTTYATFLPAGISDHSPVLVNVFDDPHIQSRFSFLNCWIAHPSYRKLITQAWHLPVQGNAMFRVFSKLKNVRASLYALHKQTYSDISIRAEASKTALLDCQTLLQSCPLSQDLILKQKQLLVDYSVIKQAEMSILKQKAKIDNIKHGDCSSKYFFSRLQERKNQQIIGRIVDRHGTERIGQTDVAEGFVDYYTHLLGSAKPTSPLDDVIIQ
ncbi:uncharacterized protein LOC141590354 [Silene latifolia]|uniref:uncharacterized protein LOC141590354 n=1 Tax=Silene latifolia TaxID=37657 RepID=UPI003D775717